MTDNRIGKAETFAFDSPADGIVEQGPNQLTFKSSTTGDTDGIDLYLKHSHRGVLTFASPVGTCAVNLADLDQQAQSFAFGGLGLRATVQRYPETLTVRQLSLNCSVHPKAGRTTPYFVKVIQEDGHMAWSSPVYARR